jgi:hypothetical protein
LKSELLLPPGPLGGEDGCGGCAKDKNNMGKRKNIVFFWQYGNPKSINLDVDKMGFIVF